MRRWVAAMVLVGCAPALPTREPVAPPLAEAALAFDARGISRPVEVILPDDARSVTVMIAGSGDAVYGVASLSVGGARVYDAGVEAGELREGRGRIFSVGSTRWLARAGSHTFVYPTLREEPLSGGRAEVRAVTSDPGAPARMWILAPRGEGSRLHVSVVAADGAPAPAEGSEMLAVAARILSSAGIELVVDERVETEPFGPVRLGAYPAPDSDAVEVARRARAAASPGAFVVALCDLNTGGLSLGVPAPPASDDPYFGVLVDRLHTEPTSDVTMGWIIAHELAHGLGLVHVTDRVDGADLDDPFEDTDPARDWLMGPVDPGLRVEESALRFTPQQAFAMRRSPLLR